MGIGETQAPVEGTTAPVSMGGSDCFWEQMVSQLCGVGRPSVGLASPDPWRMMHLLGSQLSESGDCRGVGVEGRYARDQPGGSHCGEGIYLARNDKDTVYSSGPCGKGTC